MSFDSIPIPGSITLPREAGSTWLETLHEWVTTVDHKRLGLMYIGYALLFLVIGGIEATIMRIQLAVPHARFVSPQVFNRMFTMHGTTMIFFVAMPILFGFANYLVPLMIGARDMAFPRLNAWSFWMAAFGGLLLYFSFLGGDGLYGAGSAPDVGWWAYAPLTSPAFPKGHSTDYCASGFGFRQHRDRDQHPGHHRLHALSGDDLGQNAAAGLAEPGDVRHGSACHQPADGSTDHADDRPLPGRAFLRYAGGRLGGNLDALLLDFRSPGSLCPHHPVFCLRL